MLSYFRTNRSKVLLYFVTGLVCIVMLSFGVILRQYQPRETWILKVDGREVPFKYFAASYQQMVGYFQGLMQGQFNPQMLSMFPIHTMVVENLKERELLESMTSRLHLVYSPEFVKDRILEQDVFTENNQFSFNRYKNFLARGTVLSPITPQKYEAYIGQNFLVKTLEKVVKDSFLLTENQSEILNTLRQEEYKVRVYALKKENIQATFTPTPADLESFAADPKNDTLLQNAYFKNIQKYQTKDQFQAKHILLNVSPDATPEKEKEVLQQATEIHARLMEHPEQFESIATETSEDPGSKTNGGDLGTFSAGDMVPEFENRLKTLSPNAISEPFKTQFGYHIAKLISYTPGSTKTIEDVKTELAQELMIETHKQELIDTYAPILESHFRDRKDGDIQRILEKSMQIKGQETSFFSPYQATVDPMGNAFELRKHLKHHGDDYQKDQFISGILNSENTRYVVQFLEKRQAFSENTAENTDTSSLDPMKQFEEQIDQKWQDHLYTKFKEGLASTFDVKVNEKALTSLQQQAPQAAF